MKDEKTNKKIEVYAIWSDGEWGGCRYTRHEIDESFQRKSATAVANELLGNGCPVILYEVRFPNGRSVAYKNNSFQWIDGMWQSVTTEEIKRDIERKQKIDEMQRNFDRQVREARKIMVETWNNMIETKFKHTDKDVVLRAATDFLSLFR